MAQKEIYHGINYKPAHFRDAKEFDDYISSPYYKTKPTEGRPFAVSVNNPGVCIGL